MLLTNESSRGLVRRVGARELDLPGTPLGLVAVGLALLLPLVSLRLAFAPAWTPRFALLGVEAAVGVPALLALLRTNARAAALAAVAFASIAVVSTLASDNPA